MEDVYAERHERFRQRVPAAFARFMDVVYSAMSEQDRAQLPDQTGEYVDAIVAHALRDLQQFGGLLIVTVAVLFVQSPHGERFIKDPRSGTVEPDLAVALFLDDEGELCTVRNAYVERSIDAVGNGTFQLARYSSYTILTGPRVGQRFDCSNRPLPAPPSPRKGLEDLAISIGR